MAAYASLVCLSNLMIQIKNHPRVCALFDNNQIQYLVENVDFLLDFVENYNYHGGRSKEEVEDLEKQISSAAYAAENLTENYIQNQLISGSSEKRSLAYLLDLHKLIVDMDLIKEKVREVRQKKQPQNSMIAAPSRPLTSGKLPTMVGFEDELFKLMDFLTRQHSGRTIIPVVGMGGIGKTTLIRNVYEHSLIKQNFDLRLWATISPEYSVRGILLQLLYFTQRKFTCESVHELGEQLYKTLYGRRYLIVLDDMWSIQVWDKIKVFFPNNGERSGFVITTRLSNVATQFNSSYILMKFLDEEKGWKLLCEKAFGEEECPRELEEIGKEIVKKCRGLPLSIVVIGGHLRNSSMTKEYWLEVANDINSILDSEEDERCFSILKLSYNHLPVHLKPCFIYTGILLKEYEEIRYSNLTKLWVAEGFLKQSGNQSLEEVAEVYFGDLVRRNLISVDQWLDDIGAVHTCKSHDLLRDLCLRVAEKEKFVCALNSPCSSELKKTMVDAFTIDEDESGRLVYPETAFEQVSLRFLSCTIYKAASSLYLHSSVFLLWNLQTLVMNGEENIRIIAPSEIWELPNLRHLGIRPRVCVPDPPLSDRRIVTHNLRTLLIVENLRLSEEVCKRIPNIDTVHLRYNGEASSSSYYCLHNLCSFKQLTSFVCEFKEMSFWSESGLNFPSSLRWLSLGSRYLDWEYLSLIATLVPRLEVLELVFWDSNVGQFDGEFPCLKTLKIFCNGHFMEWDVEKSHFPVLERLVLTRYRLDEIPAGIVEIPTLRLVTLEECSAPAAVSVVRILVEEEEVGNEGFELNLRFENHSDEERFWEMVEEEDLTSNNVGVSNSHRTNTTVRMTTTRA